MNRPGRKPHGIAGSHDSPEQIAVCLHCPLPNCLGTNSPRCPQYVELGQNLGRTKRQQLANQHRRRP